MSTFSQRIGEIPQRTTLQVEDLDGVTRNRIENKLAASVGPAYTGGRSYFEEDVEVWIDTVLRQRVAAYNPSKLNTILSEVVQKASWHIVLSTVKHFAVSRSVVNSYDRDERRDVVLSGWNTLFAEEGVGFRFYAEQLLPIVEPEQAQAIIGASDNPTVAPGARTHLTAALQLLRPGERGLVDAPSIVREAISACEAQARFALTDNKITLGQAAKQLAGRKNSHPAFVDGISKLYGWTSDEKGIRHASDGTAVSLSTSDAIFFLTIASAFVTWASQP